MMHDGSIIVRIKSDVLNAGEEDWVDPGLIFDSVEVLGPWPSRDIAMDKAKEFDNGEWAWKVIDL